jgi:trehalose synthase-fused probable maltokinase
MSHIETQLRDQLAWVTSRRWFGDKARPVQDVTVEVCDEVMSGDIRLLLVIARFGFEWGPDARYFVPLLAGNGPLADREVTTKPDVLRWLVEGFHDDRVIHGQGTWSWRRIGTSFPDLDGLDYAGVKPISGEQSNTSIIFDRRFMGKIFRKVPSGMNPDLEISEHLMQASGFRHVPALYGVIELEQDGIRTDIAAIQEFVPNNGDGWSWLLGELADVEKHAALLDDIRTLGTRTGEMHIALAASRGNESFEPETIGEDDAQRIIRRVIAEMEGSVEGLARHLGPEKLEQLHKGLGAMMSDAWSMVGTLLIRVHGDYHLGQTLRIPDGDFIIIDFEGEPSRSMDERRQKLPALKDVAGMVRSLGYAGATILQGTDDPAERRDIAQWVEDASSAFVGAWRSATASSDLALAPASDGAFQNVLDLMIAEKALYETRYEMNNRPDWLWIPLNALLRLVGMEDH